MEKISTSVNQTLKIGSKLAGYLRGGEIILLSGCLGAGKTVLAKGIAQGLGINKDFVISPTFVLLRVHKGKHLLQHFDLYRLKSIEDIFALGYEEYFYSQAVTLIEWPQRLKFLLPKEFLKIILSVKTKNKRLIKFIAKGRKHKELLEKIHESRTF
ncbi:MAG: tRNA (adenosine(37)-N6)-threonylcarbamoyltransferase complex ATPase subunit type 1 TsaE [Candidatus Omnitrophica bacterium]|nr:tRNA (adenosine(37)-N6)-threonylcarbamoyltransferase complex ATPase subunit type 1 TsaE [Candidatus Omnitrophota bacterium]